MADRGTLHKSKLGEFRKYLIFNQGYQEQETKGEYEVLRMIHSSEQYPVIIYRKNSMKEHYSVMDRDMDLVRDFLRISKEIQETELTNPIEVFNWVELDGKTLTINIIDGIVFGTDSRGVSYALFELEAQNE